MDLWGCSAVVTGAASGLGAETARYLAEAGAKVTVIDIDGAGVQKVADEISGLDVGLHPVLDRLLDRRPVVDQGHPCAAPEQVDSRLDA